MQSKESLKMNVDFLQITVHGEYDPCNEHHNDLAIIELTTDIPSTEGSPICMSVENQKMKKRLTATGYGYNRKFSNTDGRGRIQLLTAGMIFRAADS